MENIITNDGLLDFFKTAPLSSTVLFIFFVVIIGYFFKIGASVISKYKDSDNKVCDALKELSKAINTLNLNIEKDKVIRDERDDKYELLFNNVNSQLEHVKEQNNNIFTKLSEHTATRCKNISKEVNNE